MAGGIARGAFSWHRMLPALVSFQRRDTPLTNLSALLLALLAFSILLNLRTLYCTSSTIRDGSAAAPLRRGIVGSWVLRC